MKAVHLTQGFCQEGAVPEGVRIGSVPRPAPPEKTQVLIQVKATAVNVDDIALLQDSAGGGWFFHTRKPTETKPLVGGMEYSGVVLQVGPNVTALKVGDRVCGVQDVATQKNPGTWAEQTMAPEKDIVRIPADSDISFVQDASVGMAAFVAGDMYKRATFPPSRGSRVLVVGASGGLGTFLLCLLDKHRGTQAMDIVAVCSGKNAESVRRLGAKDVVDYNQGPFGEQLAGKDKFDVVFDFVGGTDVERNAKMVMKKGGKFITAVGPMQGVGDRMLTCWEWHSWACGLMGRLMASGCCCCCTSYQYQMAGGMPPLKAGDFHHAVIESGARAEVSMEVPFTGDDAAIREALRRVASRHTGGKVVINMEAAS